MKKEISRILDFTEKLNENPNSYCFNPSIAHWKDDLYLVCYRIFTRFLGSEKDDLNLDNENKQNHPWLKGKEWGGYDKTGFCLMKIKKNDIQLYKALNDGNSIYYYKDEIPTLSEDKHIRGHDARIIQIDENSFLLTFNLGIIDSDIKIKPDGNKEKNCEKGCLLMMSRIIDISEDENLYLKDETILCNQISQENEKNWSFF